MARLKKFPWIFSFKRIEQEFGITPQIVPEKAEKWKAIDVNKEQRDFLLESLISTCVEQWIVARKLKKTISDGLAQIKELNKKYGPNHPMYSYIQSLGNGVVELDPIPFIKTEISSLESDIAIAEQRLPGEIEALQPMVDRVFTFIKTTDAQSDLISPYELGSYYTADRPIYDTQRYSLHPERSLLRSTDPWDMLVRSMKEMKSKKRSW